MPREICRKVLKFIFGTFWLRSRHLQECSGDRAGKCPPECSLSAFGQLARSAPKSAFWVFFGVLGAKKCPKALKKHSLGHSERGAQKHSKSTPGGTFRPGPLSTPVNGGWDRNFLTIFDLFFPARNLSKNVETSRNMFLQSQRARGLKKFDRGLRDWKFRAIDRGLKFSIEPFSVHYEGPVNGNSGIELFDRDWKFRSGLKFSSPGLKFSIGIEFFRSQGPLGFLTFLRKAPDMFKLLRHVMRAIWSVRPKCSHRCVSLKETSLTLCKSSSTQPFTQPSKPLWERNGLNISRFKLFRSIS